MVARIDPIEAELPLLVARYQAGAAVKTLAQERGVPRAAVRRWLMEAGVPVRDRSAAMYARMAVTPPEERARLAAAAQEARRGSRDTPDTQARRALFNGREHRLVGVGEDEAADALARLGVTVERQVPVGPYNLDLASGRVAIEVHRNTNYPLRFPALAKRAAYLHEEGWAVLYIWCSRGSRVRRMGCVSEAAAERVATLAAFVAPGAFHVIRCTGEDATRTA